MTTKPTHTLTFKLERTTKGALKYQEADVPEGTEPVVGTLYLRKARTPGEPQSLTMTITVN